MHPRAGNASCESYGANYTWQVTDGSTFVENTSGAQWKLSFATSAGELAATTSTGTGDTADGPTFAVTDIPSTVATITVTSTLVWGTRPAYSDGTTNQTVTISRPAGGCIETITVPGAPSVTAPTCSAVGTLVVPADTASVVWTVLPTYHSGDTGNFVLTATAQNGSVFTGGSSTQTYPVTVAGKLTGSSCDTMIAPVRPTLTASECTGPGTHSSATLVIPSTTGVIYKINGVDVSGQTISETPGTAVDVIATPATGYRFHGAQSVTESVSFAHAGECNVAATPVVPSISQSDCTGPGTNTIATLVIPTTRGVVYKVNGNVVSGTITEAAGTTVTVHASPASGYKFAENATSSWTKTFTDEGNCLVVVPVAKPGFADSTCTAGVIHTASYTIPSTKNVSYNVNGSTVGAGTYVVNAGTKITVTASAAAGYSMSGPSSWTHTFATPVCTHTHVVPTPHRLTTTSVTRLASTGVPIATLVLAGSLLAALGFTLCVAGAYRRRRTG